MAWFGIFFPLIRGQVEGWMADGGGDVLWIKRRISSRANRGVGRRGVCQEKRGGDLIFLLLDRVRCIIMVLRTPWRGDPLVVADEEKWVITITAGFGIIQRREVRQAPALP